MSKRRATPKPALERVAKCDWPIRALFAGVIAGLVVPPFANQDLGMDVVIAWAALLGVLAAGILLFRGERLPRSPVGLAWMAFLAWASVSSLVSGRLWAALVGEPSSRLGLLTGLVLTAVVWASAQSAPSLVSLLRSHAWWIVIAESSLTLVRLAATRESGVGGTLPNSTYLGEALVLLLPWLLPVDGHTKGQRIRRYVAIGAALLVLAAAQSRAAFVAAAVWGVWAVAKSWRAGTYVRVATVLTALGVAAVASFTFATSSPLDAGGSLPYGGRLTMWELGAKATGQRLAFGWGPDGYWPGAASLRTATEVASEPALQLGPNAADPHNLLVWLAVSTGVIGLALWLLFAGAIVARWARTAKADPTDLAAAWSVALCLAVGLTAPIPPNVLAVLSLILGVSLTGTRVVIPDSEPRFGRGASAVVSVGLAVACAVLGANTLSRAPYEVDRADGAAQRARASATASAIWSADAHLAYRASLHAAWAAAADPSAGWQAADLAALQRAVRLDRRNPFLALERARAVAHYGGSAQAVDAAFADAFNRYPGYPLARAEYAKYLAETGRLPEAAQQLRMISGVEDGDTVRASAVEAAEALIGSGGR